jgi:hypothetical protein
MRLPLRATGAREILLYGAPAAHPALAEPSKETVRTDLPTRLFRRFRLACGFRVAGLVGITRSGNSGDADLVGL